MVKKEKRITLLPMLIIVIFLILIGIFLLSRKETKIPKKELPFSVTNLGYITIKEPGYYIINSKEELNALLSKSRNSLSRSGNFELIASFETAIPEIDFTKYTLIAVFMGEFPTSGYSVTIDKIIEDDNEILVYLTEISPGKNCIVEQVFTYPYQAVEIAKISKNVKFIPNKIVEDCD